MSHIHTQVLALRDELGTVLVERTSAIDNALLALLTGEHLLLLGPPGQAKSLLVDELHARLPGARRFKKLLNPSTTPDELLGPVDLLQVADHGRYVRRHTRSLVEADLAFLDEVGRGNSVVLNLLLNIMNEREIDEVGMDAPLHIPLLSLFGASNTALSGNDDLAALDDRFVLREIVQDIVEDDAFVRMLLAQDQPQQATMTLDELRTAQGECRQIRGTTETLEKIVALCHACQHEGIVVSPRRWKKAMKIAKARSWLDGLPEADVESLVCLTHVLWTDPKQKRTVERLVYQAACPLVLRAIEIEDQAMEVYHKLPKDDATDWKHVAENCLQQLVDQHSDLKKEVAVSHARDKTRALASLATVARLHRDVRERLFPSVARLMVDL